MGTFNKIRIGSGAVVRFHASQEFRTVVSVDENLEEYVEVFTQNDVLNIRTKSGGNYNFTAFYFYNHQYINIKNLYYQ